MRWVWLMFVCACGSSFQEDLFSGGYQDASTGMVLEASADETSTNISDSTTDDSTTEYSIIDSGNETSNSNVSKNVLDSGVVCGGRMCPVCGGNKQCCAANGSCGCAWDKCYPLPE